MAKGLSKTKDGPFAALLAVSKDQLYQLVRAFSSRGELTLPAAVGWIFHLRVKSEAIPGGRREPAENMSEMGQAH